MRYISTRNGSTPNPERLTFAEVLLAGLARDGGLYLPETWPQFSAVDIAAMRGKSYVDLAQQIMSPFVGDTFSSEEFRTLLTDAYATFDTPEVCPLKPLGSEDVHLLELFHGPTFAFKDVALQLLGRMLDSLLKRGDRRAAIVGATSGDTGSAAIEAVRSSGAIEIFMLHPKGRTSEVQRRQMTTVLAPNVHNVAIEGTFDDCQDLAKACFNDLPFRDRHRLTAVNSINFARVMAQIVYYFWAALKLGAPEKKVAFSVPTGNFGDVYAGYAAWRMGLPIAQLVIATNSNDILARFFATGEQRLETVQPTYSPSMDIQVSSNFERLLFDMYGRDGKVLADAMAAFRASGSMKVAPQALAEVRKLFDAGRLDDAGTLKVIREVAAATGETLDPHTAVAWEVGRALRRDRSVPMVVLATAHPAKFPDAVEKATGVRPALPPRLARMFDLPEKCETLPNDVHALQRLIDARAAA